MVDVRLTQIMSLMAKHDSLEGESNSGGNSGRKPPGNDTLGLGRPFVEVTELFKWKVTKNHCVGPVICDTAGFPIDCTRTKN